MKKIFNKKILIFLFIFIILIMAGKFIRYTVMKESLVDTSAGHKMIGFINDGVSFKNLIDAFKSRNTVVITAYIFSIINFFDLTTFTQFEIYVTIIWNIILFLLLFKIKDDLSVPQILLTLSSIAVLNIFDFCLSKEPIQMIFFILIYLVLISKIKSKHIKYALCIAIMLFCAITYRIYYAIAAMFMVMFFLVFEIFVSKLKKVRVRDILIILLGMSLFYGLFLFVVKHVSYSNFKELIRVRLRTSSATTDMRSLFGSTNLFIFSIDYMIMIIRMLFPIELVRFGVKYLIYVIYQLLITFILIKSIIQYKSLTQIRKLALYIFLAFVMCSATFEPDFGSWIRHEAVAFPILIILGDLIKIKNNDTFNYEESNVKNGKEINE